MAGAADGEGLSLGWVPPFPAAGVHCGPGLGVDENVSRTGAGVLQFRDCPMIRMCAPLTRHPPLEPVSPELLHAAVTAPSSKAPIPKRKIRIASIVPGNGKAAPPTNARSD